MKKKRIVAVIALAGLVALVGGTVAFYSDSIYFSNIFGLATAETEFVETFESPNNWKSCDTTPKTLVITNKSDTPVYARFKIKDYWKKNGSTSTNQNNEISPTYKGQDVAIINFQNESDWEKKGEWYYYKEPLAKGETTSSLLASVTYNCSINFVDGVTYSADGKSGTTNTNPYDNAKYHLYLTAQTIATEAKEKSWSIATFISNTSYGLGSLFPNYDTKAGVKTFVKSTSAPGDDVTTYDATGTPSDKPITVWLSDDGNTLYWYSEANEVYLPTNSSSFFKSFRGLVSVPGLADVNTSQVTNMDGFFQYDESLMDNLSLANWDVSHVTNFRYMFFYHKFATLAGLKNWDMSRATDIARMLSAGNSDVLHTLTNTTDIAGWNVSNVRNMELFMIGCGGIDASSLEGWDIDPNKVTTATNAFDDSATKPSWALYHY